MGSGSTAKVYPRDEAFFECDAGGSVTVGAGDAADRPGCS
jgi:hypothetical protein